MQEYFCMNTTHSSRYYLDQRVPKLRLDMAKKKQQKVLKAFNG